jgi:hypothetical protein
MNTELVSPDTAIAHCVTMTFKDSVGQHQIDELCAFLEGMRTSVPGLIDLHYGPDLGRHPMAADFLHFAVFQSTAALELFEQGAFQKELMARFGPSMIASATIAEIAV